MKAVLGAPNLTGQHARWWSKVYGSGIILLDIVHRAGRDSQHADTLSRQPVLPAPPDNGASKEVQIALIPSSEAEDISTLLHKEPDNASNCSDSFHEEQLRDPALCPIMNYLSFARRFPGGSQVNCTSFIVYNGRWDLGQKKHSVPKVVVPSEYKKRLMEE